MIVRRFGRVNRITAYEIGIALSRILSRHLRDREGILGPANRRSISAYEIGLAG